ncbi:MAG TPA: hypothetical protein VIG88_07000 [Lysobacter sp.]
MMFEALPPLEEPMQHTRWLHELRNVVSTASVAATIVRRLVASDAAGAAEMLQEAERALLACRDLLASGGDHILAGTLPHETLQALPPAPARRDEDRAAR